MEEAGTLQKGVSVIVPAYNEDQGLGQSLERLLGTMKEGSRPFEVLVVDDKSTDRTGQVAARYAVRLIQHPRNRGYGAALKTGIRHAKYDILAITDADGTYPNERVLELVDFMEARELDMVVGARNGRNVAVPLIRKPAKWMLTRLARYAAGQDIPDLNSGFRVFRRDLVERFLGMLPDGFSFTTTITLAALTNNYLVEYVSIDYMARAGKSKIRPFRDTVNFAKLVGRMALYFAPLKLFLPGSALLLVAAAAVAGYTMFVLGRLADVTTVVLVAVSLQLAALGLLAEMVNRRLPSYSRPP